MDSQYCYYDMIVSNINSPNQLVPCEYSETRSQPLIKDTTNYKLSIVRFSLNSSLLPVFVPTFITGSTTETIYNITLTYNGISVTQPIIYSPQNTAYQQFYNYVFSYDYLCLLINKTFTQALENLQNEILINNDLKPPTIKYDPTTQLFQITTDTNYYSTNQQNYISIIFNSALNNLFLFNFLCNAIDNYTLIFNDDGTCNQPLSTIGNLSPINSIVFTSTLFPIKYDAIGYPNIYINSQLQQGYGNSTFNILTDFIASELIFTPNIIYTPSGQYRYITLFENQTIQNTNIQVYWLDKSYNLNPIYLPNTGSCSIKLMFEYK